MFDNLIPAWFRRPSTPKRPIRKEKSPCGVRPTVETLEDRLAPATMIFSGLELTTTGAFNTQNNLVTTSSPVEVGVNPANGASFVPLLSLDSGVQFMSNDATGKFTTSGTVSGIAGGQTVPLLGAHLHTFSAPALLGNGYFTLSTGDTNPAELAVAGGKVVVTGFHLTSQELDLQGLLTLTNFSGLTLAVQGSDYIKLNTSGVQLTGLDVTLPGPTQITQDGLAITTQNLQVHYSSAGNEFDISGQASITVAGNTVGLTLGRPAAPGLEIVNGELQSLQASLNLPAGMTTIPFTVQGLSFQLSSASLTYDSAKGSFGIGGNATLTTLGQTLTVNLGTAEMPGILIENGILTTLDASINADVKIAGLDFKADDLTVQYAATAPDVTISGAASIEVDGQSVEVMPGSTDNGVNLPGIVINQNTGQLTEIDAAVTSDITIGGLTFKTDDLAVYYAAGASVVTITGSVDFELDGQMVAVTLGANGHPGIAIDPATGQFMSLNASITSDITVAGLDIKTDGLGIEYQANNLAVPL